MNKTSTGAQGKLFDNITLTGHSLGGGLASTASVWTGYNAITFNAAGVHEKTIDNLLFEFKLTKNKPSAKNQKERFENPDDLITAYFNEGDVLSTLQDKATILPIAIGNRIVIADPYSGHPDLGEDNDIDIVEATDATITFINAVVPQADEKRVYIIDFDEIGPQATHLASRLFYNYLLGKLEDDILGKLPITIIDIEDPSVVRGYNKMVENHGLFLYGLLDTHWFEVGNEEIFGCTPKYVTD